MKNRRAAIESIAALILLTAFVLLIIMLKTVDTAAIGPENTVIGLSRINEATHNAIGESSTWYLISEASGALAFPVALVFAFYGIYELIKKKSFKAVDKELYCLAALYASAAVIYLFFETVIINYRPILEKGELAASFPSSHTLISITVYGSAAIILKSVLHDKKKKTTISSVLIFLMILTVVARLFSGVHWLTDIIGAILVSSSLLLLFDLFTYQISSKKHAA